MTLIDETLTRRDAGTRPAAGLSDVSPVARVGSVAISQVAKRYRTGATTVTALDGINLKPEKGRRKDLRKIEQAVRSMRKIAFSDKKDA